MCGQHNVRASAEDNTGQNTDEEHTPNPRTEIKILDPAGTRTRAAGLEGRNSTEHATATDMLLYCIPTLINYVYYFLNGSVAQTVIRSPPISGVPNSRLRDSMRVPWSTKRGLDRFFSRFLPYSPAKNSIPYFYTLISFISFHFISSAPVLVCQAYSAGIFANNHRP